MLKLKFSNIEDGEISFYRAKTHDKVKVKKKITATLLPQMQEIINKWGNDNNNLDNYIFPFMEHGISPRRQKVIIATRIDAVNKHMKKIGRALNIGKTTTYVCRHSFATILKNSGAPIQFVSEQMGHSTTRVTEDYFGSFEKKARNENAMKLIP